MAFENIQIQTPNFTVSRDGAIFYTMDGANNTLISKNSGGSLLFTNFLDTDIQEVVSLEFDGVHFWSLERSGDVGFRVRKWLVGSDDLVRLQEQFSFAEDLIHRYDVHDMAVEFYNDSLDNQTLVGATIFDVNDGSVIRAGDKITIGPSTEAGFEGLYSDTTVINVVNSTVTVSPPIDVQFAANDDIYFTRRFFVFSDEATAGLTGALYKFDAFTGSILSLDISNLYNKVRASTFFQENLIFVRGGEVVYLDPDSQNIVKSQAIDNLTQDRTTHIEVFDLVGFSDTIYRLEHQHVFLSGGSYQVENWGAEYNYNTSSTIPEVYFVSVKANPPILHRAVTGLTPTSAITVQVLDQFRTPVFNRLVDLTSDEGALDPIQDTTDTEGIVKSEYTANSTLGEVTITATVT